MKKRVLLAVLSIVMTFSVMGAGNSDSDEPMASQMLSAPGEYPLVAEKVSYSALFASHPFVEDFKSNKLTMHLEEKTNVHLDIEVVPFESQLEKINILFASGEYPDMLNLENLPKDMVVSYGDQGFFIPLNDLIEKHAPNLKALMEEYPDFAAGMKSSDGNIYALPGTEGNYQMKFPVRGWIYEPWLSKLNMEMPQTIEEYYNYLVAVRDTDVNGNNNPNDEIPLAGAINGWYSDVLPFFMSSFVLADPNTFIVIEEGGELTFAPTTEEWKDGLRFLKKLFDEKLLAPDSFVQDENQLRQMGESVDAPILGSAPGGWWGCFTLHGNESGRYKEYTVLPPLKGPAGVKQSIEYDYQVKPQLFITDTAKNPEVLVQWADQFYTYDGTMKGYFGFEGTEWVPAEDGDVSVGGGKGLYRVLEPFGSLQNDTWHHRAPIFLTADILLGEVASNPDNLMENGTYRLTKYARDSYADFGKLAVSSNLYFSPEDVQEIAEIKATIIGANNGIIPAYTARFIIGDLDIDADWDLFLSELEAANIDRYLEIFQSTIE